MPRIKLSKAAFIAHYKSPYMHRLRREVKNRDGFECVRCGSDKELQVHHLTYKNVPFEVADDLITLCKRCHYLIDRNKSWKHYLRWLWNLI